MRFHVLSLPHISTTPEFSWCAYGNKVRRFSSAMFDRGHEVYLYGGPENAARVTEHIICSDAVVNDPGSVPPFNVNHPAHRRFNGRAIGAMTNRVERGDFICTVAGAVQEPVASFFPNNDTVEVGIGYSGTFAPHRVFESYAWMHMVYGTQHHGDIMSASGNAHSISDAVIPNLYEMEEFPFGKGDGGYYLFMGRLIGMKGWELAVQVTEKIGAHLVIAGQGNPGELPRHCDYVGIVGPEIRAHLLGGAIATFVPTQYVEPFGGVHAESMLCGTPVITTDWGVFTETVTPKVGFRCHTFREFCAAAVAAPELNRRAIRKYAKGRFSSEVVGEQYERYFERLLTLQGEGFYA